MNTEVAQKRFTMVLTTVKLPLIELWRVNEKQVDYKLTWSVHWTNQKLLYCSIIVLVVLQYTTRRANLANGIRVGLQEQK